MSFPRQMPHPTQGEAGGEGVNVNDFQPKHLLSVHPVLSYPRFN